MHPLEWLAHYRPGSSVADTALLAIAYFVTIPLLFLLPAQIPVAKDIDKDTEKPV